MTGLGAVTPVGNDMRATWESAVAGRSGIDFIRTFDTTGFPVRIAAEVKGFDPTTVASVKEVRKLDRNVLLALAAATEAVRDAGLDEDIPWCARESVLDLVPRVVERGARSVVISL